MARSVRLGNFGKLGMGFAVALALSLGVASCGKADGSLVKPCDSGLKCGGACDAKTACDTGLYCGSDAKCTADCLSGDDRCGEGRHCNGSSGHCVDGPELSVGGPDDPGPGSGGGNGMTCASTDVDLTNQLPTVLLLVDQSASMDEKFGMSDRWQTLRTALMDPGAGIVNSLQARVRFGLSLFSGRNGMTPCPALTNVAPALDNFVAINAAYPAPTESIIDDTPTGESITAAAKTLQAVTDPGPKVIVLATDGEPDTCAVPDPQTPEAKEAAIKAAQDAFATGVFTFYISVGNEVSEQHATEMANVGQGYPRNDKMKRFYRANDQMELAQAFATIVEGVRTCSFQLDGTVKDGGEAQGSVKIDGIDQKLNDPDGWKLSSPTTVQLLGKACETVKDTKMSHNVSAKFECGAIVPFKPPA